MKQLVPSGHEEWQDRAVAAVHTASYALNHRLSHLALAGAREAARAALLALAAKTPRPTGSDVARLQELASASADHLAGRPAERDAMIRASLSAVTRLIQ
ncbi:hypothetical protein [Roseomonas sp. BN140053]|uniref:hypothetical protein n=1 Tax=Roseomonas sp. BN140053 TaxID=3391898 RepID=UPI0039E853CF